MKKMMKALQSQIDGLHNDNLRRLLSDNLIKDANNRWSIFCAKTPSDRDQNKDMTGFDCWCLFSNLFAYAPTSLCLEVINIVITFSNRSQMAYFNRVSKHPTVNQGDVKRSVFAMLMQYGPIACSKAFTDQLSQWPENDLRRLLFGKEQHIEYFLTLLNPGNEQSSLHLLFALQRLEINQRQHYIYGHSLFRFGNPVQAGDFFMIKPSEKMALAFLEAIEPYPADALKSTLLSVSISKMQSMLHIVFSTQTIPVIQKIFDMLRKLDEADQIALLETRSPYDWQQSSISGNEVTPLDIAFIDNPAITPTLVDELAKSPEPFRLLTQTSFFKQWPTLHYAAQHNCVEALARYIRHPDAHLQHTAFIMKTRVIDVAIQWGHIGIYILNEAILLRNWINNTDMNPLTLAENLKKKTGLLKKYPSILHVTFQDGKNLLHLAALNPAKQAIIIPFLLAHAAPADHLDDNGISPLRALICSTHGQCTAAEAIVSKLTQYPVTTTMPSFINTLSALPQPGLGNPALRLLLTETSNGQSLYHQFRQLAQQENDLQTFFLVETAALFEAAEEASLLHQPLVEFIQRCLMRLTGEASALEREVIALQLTVLLFSMSIEKQQRLLQTTPFEPLWQQALNQILKEALLKPLISSTLSWADQRLLFQGLAYPEQTLQAIADGHFQQDHLTNPPPECLQYLATTIPFERLKRHCQQRIHPALILLTLDRALNEPAPDTTCLQSLFNQLEQELNLFNQTQSPLPLAELALLLNLACRQELKQFIDRYLKNLAPDAPLLQKTNLLFLQIDHRQPLLPGSLLGDIFLNYACQTWPNNDHQTARTRFLMRADGQAIQAVNTSHHQALQAASIEQSLELIDSHLADWLLQLIPYGNRVETLQPLSQRAYQHSKEANSLAQSIVQFVYPLFEQLESFAQRLERLGDILHDRTQDLAPATKPLAGLLEKLRRHWAQINRSFQENSLQLMMHPDYPEIACQLKQLTAALEPDLLNHPLLSEDILALSAENVQSPTPSQCMVMHERFLQGILQHPDSETFLPLLTADPLLAMSSMSDELCNRIPTLTDATTTALLLQQEAFLSQANDLTPLTSTLQCLPNEELTLGALIDVLASTEQPLLRAFHSFCVTAKAASLATLIRFILIGLEHQLDPVSLTASAPVIENGLVGAWLQQELAKGSDLVCASLSIKMLVSSLYIHDDTCIQRLDDFQTLIHTALPSLKAIQLFIASYESLLEQDWHSNQAQAFVMAFNSLLSLADGEIKSELLAGLSNKQLDLLLQHCLSGLTNDNPIRSEVCRRLLTQLCQYSNLDNDEQVLTIKHTLGQQQLDFLSSEALKSIAQGLVNAPADNVTLTLHGVWIQRLLTEPRFIASCQPPDLHQLSERYRALSLTLKQEEFEQLNGFISGQLSFANQHGYGLAPLQQSLLAEPERRAMLIEKRNRLLTFRAADSLRALFNRLEDNCQALNKTEPLLAQQALAVLAAYHAQQLGGMRSDFLFRISQFLYQQALKGNGDLPAAQNAVLGWITQHLPHHNFHQNELAAKSSVLLYDSDNQQIGFVDESSQAYSFIDHRMVPLSAQAGMQPGMALYDQYRRRLGTLTETGQLKRDNLFQQSTSALLISKIPSQALQQHPVLMQLLVQDVIQESSLETLYAQIDDSDQRQWVEATITHHLIASPNALPQTAAQELVAHHSLPALLTTLKDGNNVQNAARLFHAILEHDDKRQLFFETHTADFDVFLSRVKAHAVLADYLIYHHDKSWFNQGFSLFAAHAVQQNDWLLLGRALLKISKLVLSNQVMPFEFDAILHQLIYVREHAGIVLRFLNRRVSDNIQENTDPSCSFITRWVNKSHLLSAIEQLNSQSTVILSPQKYLVLLIFHHEHQRLFPERELRYAESAWKGGDLVQLSRFLKRHLQSTQIMDKDFAIGKRLLHELVFRCANFGQTELFYQDNGQINRTLLEETIQRSAFETLAARHLFIGKAAEAVQEAVAAFKSLFTRPAPRENLKNSQLVMDWSSPAKKAWNGNKESKLPLLVAFLINYSGAKGPLLALLQDVVQQYSQNNKKLYPIAQLMVHSQDKAVSKVIFAALKESVIANPERMDPTLLSTMAAFYSGCYLKGKGRYPRLDLIKHFGQHRHYELTQHCCELILNDSHPRSVRLENSLNRAALEAKIEQRLLPVAGRWFFAVLQFFIRIWHYGLHGFMYPTGIVKFCDDQGPQPTPLPMPETIEADCIGGQVIDNDLEYRQKVIDFKEKHHGFLVRPQRNPIAVTGTALGLFHEVEEMDIPIAWVQPQA